MFGGMIQHLNTQPNISLHSYIHTAPKVLQKCNRSTVRADRAAHRPRKPPALGPAVRSARARPCGALERASLAARCPRAASHRLRATLASSEASKKSRARRVAAAVAAAAPPVAPGARVVVAEDEAMIDLRTPLL